jgi:hypothetical protein
MPFRFFTDFRLSIKVLTRLFLFLQVLHFDDGRNVFNEIPGTHIADVARQLCGREVDCR